MPRKTTITKSKEAIIFLMYVHQKKTLSEVTRLLKCSNESVKKVLREKGIHIRTRFEYKKPNEVSPEDVCKEYQNGKTMKECSLHFHTSPHFIREILLKCGVKIRQRGGQTQQLKDIQFNPDYLRKFTDADVDFETEILTRIY